MVSMCEQYNYQGNDGEKMKEVLRQSIYLGSVITDIIEGKREEEVKGEAKGKE